MNNPIIKQDRFGEFHANVIPRGQCGFRVGQKRFSYHAHVEVTELDENGWVLDNFDLDRLFDRWAVGQWEASCEDLAGGGVLAILECLGDRAERVTVSIHPNDFASLEVDWQRGNAWPTWVPRKVEETGDDPAKELDAAVIAYSP
jgi:hypothetical protein